LLFRAATRRAQLTVTTSSTKRRKFAEPRRPGGTAALPQARHADAAGRRPQHRHEPGLSTSLSSSIPAGTAARSTSDRSSSASPSPRYIPAHLQDEVLGIRTKARPRSPTPESACSAESPSTACAGLTLSSDTLADMSGSEKSDPVRSSSPAVKRSADEIDPDHEQQPRQPQNEEQKADVEMDMGSEDQSVPQRASSVDMMGAEEEEEEEEAKESPTVVYPTPSSMSTYTTTSSTRRSSQSQESHATHDLPSIDDQVAHVTRFMMMPLQEKQKGYVISSAWLRRVLSRSSTHAETGDKTATEGEIGPVDNSDLVLVTDPVTSFKDETGEPFVPMRPGLQISEDYEIVPQEAWDLIMKWYGLASQSPAIVRYAHNTASGGDAENVQYEVNPPVFTILKLSSPVAGTTPQTLREKSTLPIKTLASRHTNFQKWLKEVKGLANIDITTKVRVWRILGGLGSAAGSAVMTPVASRSASPAPAASLVASAGNSLALDLNTFLSLSEGSQRELLEECKDQTNNANYNGKMTLDVAGLGGSDVIVLEERAGGANGDWVSEASKQTLSRLGVPTGAIKATKLKSDKSPASSGRSSPVLEPIRGRRKDGKPRGCTGLSNLGNTCYMNSALQCVRSVEELTYYFLNNMHKKDLNPSNPLAHNGDFAKVYANLLHLIYDEAGQSSFAPRQLKNTIGRYGPAFSGYGQQDSQEFLLFLLDGLQEDLNRIQKKPYIEKPDSTDEMVRNKTALREFADKNWDIYKARNDSVITDLFAGMYKSTLVCPECDKVSIIFDPFNNLTLQIPIENLWSKEIFFFPLNGKPVLVDVEIDKNASVKALKELIAKKVGSDAQRLVMAEIYKYKFYRMFDNTSSIAELQINTNDDIGIYELESVPTNYNPDKVKKSFSMYSFNSSQNEEVPSFKSPKADRLLVPIFHRAIRPKANNRFSQRSLFGAPLYTVISREEAYNYDAILKKILAGVATMTTRDILHEDASGEENQEAAAATAAEDSDTVIMNDDDAESADSKIKTSSVEGEDGLVDVSMQDASDVTDPTATPQKVESTGIFIPPALQNLFDVKIVKSAEVVPLGFQSVDENKGYMMMTSRLKAKQPPPGKQPKRERMYPNSTHQTSRNNSSTDVSKTQQQQQQQAEKGPLIRPGEGIVLDWNEKAYDALFGGDARDPGSLRGGPTWTHVEHLPDPELKARRDLRHRRKKRGVTLNECLDEFNKEEILSENDAWYCPRCKEHRRASKKFELWKTPDILVMHLKRFSASRGFRDKIDVLVDFPVEGLDMTGRVENPEEDKSLVYDLFAVDNHYGGLGGGHYTAFAKNFINDEWYEYNDSHVSKVSDPQRVVTPAAYLLFYRRRSERPLGGKVLEEITESSTRPPTSEADSPAQSRGTSPSGEGKRLGGSSRNGSSSALAGVGAAHQAGGGGLRTEIQAKTNSSRNEEDDDELPGYSNNPASGEQILAKGSNLTEEGMDFDDDNDFDGGAPLHSSFGLSNDQPMWSFDRLSEDADVHHGPLSSQMLVTNHTPSRPGSDDDREGEDEDLFDDNASNTAVGGGDLSDSDTRLVGLTDSPDPGAAFGATSFEDIPPQLDDDEDEELPVVELRVHDEEKLDSD
ncbi:hypothetical protein ASPZODRAFT_64832, partial [Penicilliopsis zonata CBS 506.65]